MELCKKEIKNFLYQSFPILASHPILTKRNCSIAKIEKLQWQILIKKINGENMDCKMCGKVVDCEIIRAIGFVFHPDCFKCCVCNRNLSDQEIPFTADKENRLYCQPCYNEYVF